MAQNTIVTGMQWGDEAKGKLVDILSALHDITVRFQGGANAGHTFYVALQKFVTHLVPSNIARKGQLSVVGPGVVADTNALAKELFYLGKLGLDVPSKLRISERTTVITPYHRILDLVKEMDRQGGAIGTTGRGIGPAYADVADRKDRIQFYHLNIWRPGDGSVDPVKEQRLSDMVHDIVERRVRLLTDYYKLSTDDIRGALKSLTEKELTENQELLEQGLMDPGLLDYTRFYDSRDGLSADAIVESMVEAVKPVRECIVDTSVLLTGALRDGKSILYEGAQGVELDVDHGTIPDVTSSHPVAPFAFVGAGVGLQRDYEAIGVAKAYTTRVGNGLFPTELDGALAETIRESGGEYGASTGRPRRVGWFDAVQMRHAQEVSGVDKLCIAKLDVLTGLLEVNIATSYETKEGSCTGDFPADKDVLAGCKPKYSTFPGWTEDISQARSWSDLPDNARRYLDALQSFVGVQIGYVGVGISRNQMVER